MDAIRLPLQRGGFLYLLHVCTMYNYLFENLESDVFKTYSLVA